MEAKTIYKNHVVISLSFFMLFVAFNGIQSLQRQAKFFTQSFFYFQVRVGPLKNSAQNFNFSSINCEGGLGTAALTAIYAGLVVGSLFLPTITIQRLGLKWTMERGNLTLCIVLNNNSSILS